MITLAAYFILRFAFNDDWSGWLLVLPVLFDIVAIERFNTIRVTK
jgi:hypothetical protein